MRAYEVHAHEVHAHEVHAYKTHAHVVHAYACGRKVLAEYACPGVQRHPIVESLKSRSVPFCYHHSAGFTLARGIELVAKTVMPLRSLPLLTA
jgi:hypothetical protein